MDFTGERYVPEKFEESDSISRTHLKRYEFAAGFVEGLSVLDIACGEGYGSNLLARRALRVHGIDIDDKSIEHAKNKYTEKNISFSVGSVVKINLEDASVDAVISFETIEHVNHKDQKSFLKEVKRILKPEGMFIVSTPDKDIYGEGHNKFHLREFNKKGFERELRYYFKNIDMYAQDVAEYRGGPILYLRRAAHKLIKFDKYHIRHKIFPKSIRMKIDSGLIEGALQKNEEETNFPIKVEKNKTGMYLIAVCS